MPPKDRLTKGRETRAAILTKGVAMASVLGLEGISIGTLAQETGLSKSGLYAHFRSKDKLQIALLQTALARFVEDVISPALRAPRGEPRVRELFHRWLVWEDSDFQPGGCIFISTAVEFDERPGPVRDVLVQSQRDWLDTLSTAARIAVEEGHFRADLDPKQMAHDVYAVAFGYHFISRLLREPDARDRAKVSFERIIEDARP